tara:strand:+ start:633 stop:923 length:291 start_codon:yes stop_codon:yes gene_type:complete
MDLKEKVMDKVEDVIESIDGDELCESVAVELHLDDPEKGVLDGIQEKLISRKLLVFGVATALMIWSTLDPDTWGLIAMMYIGGQSAIDLARTWRHG